MLSAQNGGITTLIMVTIFCTVISGRVSNAFAFYSDFKVSIIKK